MEKQPPTPPAVSDENGVIVVGWDGQDDPLNPANQSTARKLFMTLLVSLIALSVTAASAIDACGVREYSEYFQISEVVGSLATGTSSLRPVICLFPSTVKNKMEANSCTAGKVFF